jgi:hypothetical protein
MPTPNLHEVPKPHPETGFCDGRQFITFTMAKDNSHMERPNVTIHFSDDLGIATSLQGIFPTGGPVKAAYSFLTLAYAAANIKGKYTPADPRSMKEAYDGFQVLIDKKIEVEIKNFKGSNGRIWAEITQIYEPQPQPQPEQKPDFNDPIPEMGDSEDENLDPKLTNLKLANKAWYRTTVISRNADSLHLYARRLVNDFKIDDSKKEFRKHAKYLRNALEKLEEDLNVRPE